MPFSRDIRAVVYQRAKMQLDKRPFGTQEDVYREGYEWMHHSVAPKAHAGEKFRITIGGPDCKKPYSASVFNISAMSFGALIAQRGARAQCRRQEGRLRTRHRRGRRQPLSPARWAATSSGRSARAISAAARATARSTRTSSRGSRADDQIKMVELKISQGAKPGHGGVLPAAKVSEEISKIRGVPMGEDCISPALAPRLLDADRDDAVRRRHAQAVGRQARRLQAVHRPSLGIPGDLQGDAGDRHLSRLHRGRRQ